MIEKREQNGKIEKKKPWLKKEGKIDLKMAKTDCMMLSFNAMVVAAAYLINNAIYSSYDITILIYSYFTSQ